MNVNLYVIEDYENETAFRPKKTNPNKPNFFKGQNELKITCQKIQPHQFQQTKKKSGQSRKERLESLFWINPSRRKPRP